jgi:hypothetical protein
VADSFKTLADLVTLNDQRNAERNISDIFNDAPVIAKLAADTAPETTFYYTKYTTAPTVGFRAVNDGRDNSKSGDTQISVALKILDATYAVDVALADNYNKGGKDAYLAKEGMRHLKAAFFKAEQQMFYGTGAGGDAGGFSGLANETDLDGLADVTNVVNAGGTTAATASSAWLIRTTGDNNGTSIIAGKSGNIEIGDTSTVRLAGATGTYPAYYTPVTGWMGLQRGGKYSVVRIVNLTADAGKGLTDLLIAKALALFPSNNGPTLIAANRRSLEQLRGSRTATNATGAPAPMPTDAFGVPIISTDALISTEALVA